MRVRPSRSGPRIRSRRRDATAPSRRAGVVAMGGWPRWHRAARQRTAWQCADRCSAICWNCRPNLKGTAKRHALRGDPHTHAGRRQAVFGSDGIEAKAHCFLFRGVFFTRAGFHFARKCSNGIRPASAPPCGIARSISSPERLMGTAPARPPVAGRAAHPFPGDGHGPSRPAGWSGRDCFHPMRLAAMSPPPTT